MSINFKEDMGFEAKSRILNEFAVEAIDDRTALLNGISTAYSRQMSDIARAAKQPVTIELNEIGDRKTVGGVVYELDEKGWRRLPIGTTEAKTNQTGD